MENYKIDLIILDIMLPDMDGYAFAELLRSCSNDIPILMLSAKQQPQDIKQGFPVLSNTIFVGNPVRFFIVYPP